MRAVPVERGPLLSLPENLQFLRMHLETVDWNFGVGSVWIQRSGNCQNQQKYTQHKYKTMRLASDCLQGLLNSSVQRLGSDYTAYLLSFMNTCVFTLSVMAMKFISFCPFYYALLHRGALAVLLTYWIAHSKNITLTPKDMREQGFLFLRSFCLSFNQFVLTYSIKVLPASVSLTLMGLGPIFCFILNYFIYGISVSKSNLLGILASIIGILAIINRKYFQESGDRFQHLDIMIYSIMSQAVWAFGVLQTNQLSKETSTLTISIHNAFFLLIAGCIFHVQEEDFILSAGEYVLILVLVGIPSTIGHNLFNLASRTSKKIGNTMLIGYVGVVIGYGVDLAKGQKLTLLGTLGSLMTGLGLFLVLYVPST